MAHHLVLIDKSRPPKLTHTFSNVLLSSPSPAGYQATPTACSPELTPWLRPPRLYLCACPMVTPPRVPLRPAATPPSSLPHLTHASRLDYFTSIDP
ncbi:hypothetical protein E2C01_009500 [Portunus trituberculatus]|uniref:Uncharacterized protein n=1 Tax=Portunus trituberculatus TaxID=210409 RepID=A0A5B7D5Y6_PORTR|nr:hypothetical protein [Portunus trituberculatus]